MITDMKSSYRGVTDEQLANLRAREDALYEQRTPEIAGHVCAGPRRCC